MSKDKTRDSTQSFLGRGWSFPPFFNQVNKNVEMVSGAEDIRQSLGILMDTALGERFLQPDYGSNLMDFVFSPMNTTTETEIKTMLKSAILNGEPRIVLENINLKVG